MKIENRITAKRVYLTPEIERVMLDNEISLALQSTEKGSPPGGPGNENRSSVSPEFLNNDPFRNNRV